MLDLSDIYRKQVVEGRRVSIPGSVTMSFPKEAGYYLAVCALSICCCLYVLMNCRLPLSENAPGQLTISGKAHPRGQHFLIKWQTPARVFDRLTVGSRVAVSLFGTSPLRPARSLDMQVTQIRASSQELELRSLETVDLSEAQRVIVSHRVEPDTLWAVLDSVRRVDKQAPK
jgi:hypothetical protein